MFFDFKITTWERIRVPEESEEEVLEKIKSGEITSANGVVEFDPNSTIERLDNADTQLTPSQHGGQATIEVLTNDNKETLFTNEEKQTGENSKPTKLMYIVQEESRGIPSGPEVFHSPTEARNRYVELMKENKVYLPDPNNVPDDFESLYALATSEMGSSEWYVHYFDAVTIQ